MECRRVCIESIARWALVAVPVLLQLFVKRVVGLPGFVLVDTKTDINSIQWPLPGSVMKSSQRVEGMSSSRLNIIHSSSLIPAPLPLLLWTRNGTERNEWRMMFFCCFLIPPTHYLTLQYSTLQPNDDDLQSSSVVSFPHTAVAVASASAEWNVLHFFPTRATEQQQQKK